jgi:hypothetical protein
MSIQFLSHITRLKQINKFDRRKDLYIPSGMYIPRGDGEDYGSGNKG